MTYSASDIITYYEECENAYRDAWGMDHNKQLNLGLWEKGTKNLSEALFNLNKKIAELAGITKNSIVLDAGCGVGGTAIYLAKNFDCKVTGISITPRQIDLAKKNAMKEGLESLTNFQVMDFCRTNLPDESFDVVIGMESIVYAEPKSAFLKEAFRLLRPGGSLVLAENLQGKEKLTQSEYDILYTHGFNGCKVKSLDTEEAYIKNLKDAGFKEFSCEDKTQEIRPSVVRLRRFYYVAWAYNKWYRLMGKPFSATQEANTKMCYYLLSGLDKGLWKYGLIRAVKK